MADTKCGMCGATFKTQEELQKHAQEAHPKK